MHTLVIAAYHPFALIGLYHAVREKYPDTKIVGHTSSVKGFSTLLKEFHPDTAIVDVAITWNTGMDLLDEVDRIHPDIDIHFFNVHPLDQRILHHLRDQTRKRFKKGIVSYLDLDHLISSSLTRRISE